jgi:hypothetical protein
LLNGLVIKHKAIQHKLLISGSHESSDLEPDGSIHLLAASIGGENSGLGSHASDIPQQTSSSPKKQHQLCRRG